MGEGDCRGEEDLLETTDNGVIGEAGDTARERSVVYRRGGREVTLKEAGGLYSGTGVGKMRSSWGDSGLSLPPDKRSTAGGEAVFRGGTCGEGRVGDSEESRD